MARLTPLVLSENAARSRAAAPRFTTSQVSPSWAVLLASAPRERNRVATSDSRSGWG